MLHPATLCQLIEVVCVFLFGDASDHDLADTNIANGFLTLTLHFIVDPNAPRKRRSRWGEAKTEIPGLPTAISAAGVSQAQLDNYAIHLRLEEINRKLRLNDFIPPERERSARRSKT